MIHALCENGVKVIIRQRVVNGFSRATVFHEPRLLERAKLMRDRRYLHPKHLGNVANTQLGVI